MFIRIILIFLKILSIYPLFQREFLSQPARKMPFVKDEDVDQFAGLLARLISFLLHIGLFNR